MSPRVATALTNIRFARDYTVRLLDAVPPADWFRVPPAGVTHVGWQVGHLAFAQYRLVLERARGVRPDDADVLPPEYFPLFGRESVADPDPAKYPSPDAIRAAFDAVYARVLIDLPAMLDAALDDPPRSAHMLCKTRLECLHWCSHHEMLHAGRVGLLRRQLGRRPLWGTGGTRPHVGCRLRPRQPGRRSCQLQEPRRRRRRGRHRPAG